MFWGLIMEPNKRYTQTVEKAFHVSMATLDVTTADDGIVQVMLCYDNRNYLLCNLQKSSSTQVGLDLNFKEGTRISFTSNGRGHVHLTGYLIPDDLEDLEQDLDDDIEEEEVPELVGKNDKRKAKESPVDKKSLKRLKSSKPESSDEDDDDDDDEEEEDQSLLEVEDDSDSDEEVEDEEGSDEEEDDDEDEDDDEEEVKPQLKTKLSKQQKKQQQQQQNQSQEDKARKQNNLVNGKDKKEPKKKNNEDQSQNEQMAKKKMLTGGVAIEELKVGTGAPAKSGKFISVYYVGRLKNGKKFDSTTSGDGFKFRLGKGEVIKGWDIGVQGMKVGGKRRITIPAPMGYGAKGSPPTIPGNSTLVFEVELKNVH